MQQESPEWVIQWLICACDMTLSCVWYDSFMCVTWLIHTCDMVHSYVRLDSFLCVTWLFPICDMTQSYAWYDSLIYVTRLIHMSSVQCSRHHGFIGCTTYRHICPLWLCVCEFWYVCSSRLGVPSSLCDCLKTRVLCACVSLCFCHSISRSFRRHNVAPHRSCTCVCVYISVARCAVGMVCVYVDRYIWCIFLFLSLSLSLSVSLRRHNVPPHSLCVCVFVCV